MREMLLETSRRALQMLAWLSLLNGGIAAATGETWGWTLLWAVVATAAFLTVNWIDNRETEDEEDELS